MKFTQKSKIIKTVIVVIVLLATTIFLAKTFLNYYYQIKDILSSISPIKFFLSLIIFLGYLYIRALSWKSLANFLGASINRTNSLSIWFFSEATRYIPGSIWSFASRAYLAQQKNISKSVSFLISPVEGIIVVTTTTALSLYAIIKNLENLQVSLMFYIVIITSLFVTLAMLILHKAITKILKKMFIQTLNPKALVTALLLQILSWSLYSFGYIVLISDLTKVPDLFFLFSTTILAWLVGYLSIITPMGLGVRESVFVLLTGAQIGVPQAALIAVLARIILIIAEVLNLLFWAGFKRKTY